MVKKLHGTFVPTVCHFCAIHVPLPCHPCATSVDVALEGDESLSVPGWLALATVLKHAPLREGQRATSLLCVHQCSQPQLEPYHPLSFLLQFFMPSAGRGGAGRPNSLACSRRCCRRLRRLRTPC